MNAKKLLFYLLAVLLGGCLPVMSLHPLFNKKDVVFDKKLLGTWVEEPNVEEPNKSDTVWEFTRPDPNENAYRLILSNEEGKKGLFIAHLVKLKDKLFLDAFPDRLPYYEPRDPNEEGWAYNSLFLLPLHTFIKVDALGPQLILRLTDDEKMAEFLTADPNAVKVDSLEDGPAKYLLTASTKELQAFILKYADDSRVFTNAIVLGRKKTADPNAPPPSK